MKNNILEFTGYFFRFFSVLFFISSLSGNCFIAEGREIESMLCFIMGFPALLYTFENIGQLCWLANPLLIVSWFQIKNHQIAFILSLVSFVLSLSFLFIRRIFNFEHGLQEVTEMLSGYWLWLFSNILMLASSIVNKYLIK